MSQTTESLDGVLVIDKPVGYTSHDVVDAVRDTFAIRKAGHCGTLDPNGTGVLVLVLGRGTKLSERLMAEDKSYSGTARFGVVTDSYDVDGRVIDERPVPELSAETLNAYAAEFVGDQLQTPPMLSATKKSGKRLYKLARKGIEVERKPKLIHVYQFRFSHYSAPDGEFVLSCTKGTYVRSLVHELGEKIGCGAYLSSLRRLASGRFTVDQAIPLADLLQLPREEMKRHVVPMHELLAGQRPA